jgi:hypothetical protein
VVVACAAVALSVPTLALGHGRRWAPTGSFSVPGGPDHSPLVHLNAVDHGRALSPGTTVACTTGADPGPGLPAHAAVVLIIARRVNVSSNRSFSYSGPAAAYTFGSSGPFDVPTTVSITGRFLLDRRAPFATGLRGALYSSACASPLRLFSTV